MGSFRRLASGVVAGFLAAEPATAQGLADVAFLAGAWRGESDGMVFEETWGTPAGGVMTGMARGVKDGRTIVLEYIVIEEAAEGLIMRFKHFRPDYSTWETAGPIELHLSEVDGDDAAFRAVDAGQNVQSVRYFLTAKGGLQADVSLLEEAGPREFSLYFRSVD